jgi:hypothetical protein
VNGDVTVLVVDNLPDNAAAAEIQAGLLHAANAIAQRSDVVGAVVVGASKSAIAGSISERALPQVEAR